MHACEECCQEHNLKHGMFPSLGKCEMCGTVGICLQTNKEGYTPEPPAFADAFRESIAESNRKQMNRAGDKASKLATIEALCRRYNSPASEPGTHALAAKVIKIIEGATP